MRSSWKGDLSLMAYKFSTKHRLKNRKIFRKFVGNRVSLYNGKNFTNLYIKNSMVGYKFDQFIFTKRYGCDIHLNYNK